MLRNFESHDSLNKGIPSPEDAREIVESFAHNTING